MAWVVVTMAALRQKATEVKKARLMVLSLSSARQMDARSLALLTHKGLGAVIVPSASQAMTAGILGG